VGNGIMSQKLIVKNTRLSNIPEDEKSENSSTSGVLDILKVQDTNQKCE